MTGILGAIIFLGVCFSFRLLGGWWALVSWFLGIIFGMFLFFDIMVRYADQKEEQEQHELELIKGFS